MLLSAGPSLSTAAYFRIQYHKVTFSNLGWGCLMRMHILGSKCPTDLISWLITRRSLTFIHKWTWVKVSCGHWDLGPNTFSFGLPWHVINDNSDDNVNSWNKKIFEQADENIEKSNFLCKEIKIFRRESSTNQAWHWTPCKGMYKAVLN